MVWAKNHDLLSHRASEATTTITDKPCTTAQEPLLISSAIFSARASAGSVSKVVFTMEK